MTEDKQDTKQSKIHPAFYELIEGKITFTEYCRQSGLLPQGKPE